MLSGLAVGVAVAHLFWPYILHLLGEGSYTVSLFIGVPVVMGFASTLFLGFHRRHRFSRGVWALVCGQVTVAALLVLTKWEGAMCLVMALPLTFSVGLFGSWMGWLLANAIVDARNKRFGVTFAFLMPFVALGFVPSTPHTNHHRHVTVRVIKATPERIWPFLLNLHDLPPATELVFRMGMAYPIGTRASGKFRVCELSTGSMPERIRTAEKNRVLRFDVVDVPPAMRETNPFGEVHAPHNIEAFRPLSGEFLLEPLPGGFTKVTATTWYDSEYGPDFYWSLWTEAVVGSVHNRVLDEIEKRARE